MTQPRDPFPVTVLSDGSLVLQLPSFISVPQGLELRNTIKQLCETQPSLKKIILDMGKTAFIDSGGIGGLAAIAQTVRSHQIQLVLWSLLDQPKMILAMTKMDQVLPSEADTAAILPPSSLDTSKLPVFHPSVHSKTKRLIDITLSLIGLGITAVLFIPIAVAIQLDNPGPILFSQTRCGWMGKRFQIWKFRSMITNAEALKTQVKNEAEGAFFKNKNDPRITRVGRILRKTSLDEFPQFWNVLVGDMSIVGTRPPTTDELERYDVPEWQRFDVKPGITGEWQVNGRSKVLKFEDVIQMDLNYQHKWSIGYDLQLIAKTFVMLLRKRDDAF